MSLLTGWGVYGLWGALSVVCFLLTGPHWRMPFVMSPRQVGPMTGRRCRGDHAVKVSLGGGAEACPHARPGCAHPLGTPGGGAAPASRVLFGYVAGRSVSTVPADGAASHGGSSRAPDPL